MAPHVGLCKEERQNDSDRSLASHSLGRVMTAISHRPSLPLHHCVSPDSARERLREREREREEGAWKYRVPFTSVAYSRHGEATRRFVQFTDTPACAHTHTHTHRDSERCCCVVLRVVNAACVHTEPCGREARRAAAVIATLVVALVVEMRDSGCFNTLT